MPSAEERRDRARSGGNSQTSFEGILGEPPQPAEIPREPSAAAARAAGTTRRKEPAGVPDEEGEERVETVGASLDTIEEKIKLLLARYEELSAAHAAAEARRSAGGGLDPIALQERVRALEADTERLERHAAFLEDRIRGLLSRVRYVIES